MVEKKNGFAQLVCSDPLRLRQLPRYFLQLNLCWQVDRNRIIEKLRDMKRDFDERL